MLNPFRKAKAPPKTYSHSLGALCKLIEENDIIEIVVLFENRKIKIGSSAECDRGDSVCYNKEYYIDQHSFQNSDEFRQNITNIFSGNEIVNVVTIDGVSPKYYEIDE